MEKRNGFLKSLAAVFAAAVIGGAVVPMVFSGCGPVEKEEPPIEEEIDPEKLVYNEDGFNREGFVKAFNDVMNSELNEHYTYYSYLNHVYEEVMPMFIWFDKDANAIRYVTFGKLIDDLISESTNGEFRVVSFYVDLDSCKTWDEFKELFKENVSEETIEYTLFADFDHMAGGEVIEDLDLALIDIAREYYNETYSDYNTIQDEAFFFGLTHEVENGKMCYPVGTLVLNDKNELEFMGVYVYAENEEELLNGNFEVGPANAERQVIAKYDGETYCDLTYQSMQNEVARNGYDVTMYGDHAFVAPVNVDGNKKDVEKERTY